VTRFLGVDYGTKRIGLAISDGIGLTARPLQVVARNEAIDEIRRLDSEYGLEAVIVGLPTTLGGHEGVSATAARELGEQVRSVLDVEVVYVDERFTSRMAEESLLETGMRRRDRKETVDKVAAAIILQTYLDSRRRTGNSPGSSAVEPPSDQ
jgi:putative holliday junction resolvase